MCIVIFLAHGLCQTSKISLPFSIPSSNQASMTSSAGVSPVPSSRVEKRHMPMVLVSSVGAAVLRPSSSNGWRKEVKKLKWKEKKKKEYYNKLFSLSSYLQGVVSLELPIRCRGRWCRRFVVTHCPGDKLLNTHDSVCPQTLVQVGAQLGKKKKKTVVVWSPVQGNASFNFFSFYVCVRLWFSGHSRVFNTLQEA